MSADFMIRGDAGFYMGKEIKHGSGVLTMMAHEVRILLLVTQGVQLKFQGKQILRSLSGENTATRVEVGNMYSWRPA